MNNIYIFITNGFLFVLNSMKYLYIYYKMIKIYNSSFSKTIIKLFSIKII